MSKVKHEIQSKTRAALVGRTVTNVRPMTDEEVLAMDWPTGPYHRTAVIELDDGTRLYAASDPAHNKPATLVARGGGNLPDGYLVVHPVIKKEV